MAATPYVERAIDLTFQLGEGSFGASGFNTLTLRGLRVVVHVELAGVPNTGMAVIRAYGMTLDHMNQLSMAGLLYKARGNTVMVQAGDAPGGGQASGQASQAMTTIFNGIIVEAYPDMREMPNTAFFIRASPTALAQLKPVAANSFQGATPVEKALTAILNGSGFTLENNGVSTVLSNPYFPGTVWQQVLACVRAANCFAHIDPVAKMLAIWPKGGSRSGSAAEISPATGMIGYPSFQFTTTKIRHLFDPAIKPGVGQKIKVTSDLKAANGEFTVVYLTYDLAAQMPDGPWEMNITATPVV